MYDDDPHGVVGYSIKTVEDFERALPLLAPEQFDYNERNSSHLFSLPSGEKWAVARARLFARASDVPFMAGVACQLIYFQIRRHVELASQRNDHSGGMALYWRERPEVDAIGNCIVVEFDDNGPDYHPMTDKRCLNSHDWFCVSAYARFVYARKPNEPGVTWGTPCAAQTVLRHDGIKAAA